MAHIISVTYVGHFQSAQVAEVFFEREEIRKRLAGMIMSVSALITGMSAFAAIFSSDSC